MQPGHAAAAAAAVPGQHTHIAMGVPGFSRTRSGGLLLILTEGDPGPQ
jgi:hypothetical protein